MQITFTFKDGATAKDIATQLRFQAGLLEGMNPKKAASNDNTLVTGSLEVEEDDDFVQEAPKAKAVKKAHPAKKAAASFDDEDEEQAEAAALEDDEVTDEDDDFTTEAPKAKAKKAAPVKKLTIDDVNDACLARAKRSNRAEVLALLNKHFKTKSVSEIPADKWPKVIEVMK